MKKRNIFKKITVAFSLMILLFAFSGNEVSAKQRTVPKGCFDYDWYLKMYPEVANMGLTKDQIYDYYLTTGLEKGWGGRSAKSSLLSRSDFDYDYYLAANPDLEAVFGRDEYLLYKHWDEEGKYEGRSARATNEVTNAKMECYDIMDATINSSMSTMQKVEAIFDWTCSHIQYDHAHEYSESHDIKGALLNRKAVCDGYAKTVDYFMRICGLESKVVYGTTAWGEGHAWAKVNVDGTWYNVDCAMFEIWETEDDYMRIPHSSRIN